MRRGTTMSTIASPANTGTGERLLMTSVPRRKALSFVLVSLAYFFAALCYPILRYVITPSETSPLANDALAGSGGELKPNSGKKFRFGYPLERLIRLISGEYRSMF